jgi:hypothetical protein
MPNHVTKAAPWLRRHIEQWQCAQKSVGGVTRKRIAPHRQAPMTASEDEATGGASANSPVSLRPF